MQNNQQKILADELPKSPIQFKDNPSVFAQKMIYGWSGHFSRFSPSGTQHRQQMRVLSCDRMCTGFV